jgi:hypothetical protein
MLAETSQECAFFDIEECNKRSKLRALFEQ